MLSDRDLRPNRRDQHSGAQKSATERPSQSLGLTPTGLLQLQRDAGNRAVTTLVQREPQGAGSLPAPQGRVREKVVRSSNVGERSRTVAKIEITGHASPRWRGARTARAADDKNWELAERRAEAARMEVESQLIELLPDHQLQFEYRFKRGSEAATSAPIQALDEPADVGLDVAAVGSSETLTEAGRRGRTANDEAMRRVDVKVTLHDETETDVEETIKRSERKRGDTRDWALRVAGQAGAEAVAKAGGILVQLRNNKTGAEGTFAGSEAGGAIGVGVNIAKTSWPSFENFETPEPMSFADFSGARFTIESGFGIAIGVGWESAQLFFLTFPGGKPVPRGPIDVGGVSFGGIGIGLGGQTLGWMGLTNNPSEEYTETTYRKEQRTFESFAQQSQSHRLYFDTGKAELNPTQTFTLKWYLFGVAERLR